MLAERKDETLTAKISLTGAPRAGGYESERSIATIVAGEHTLTIAPAHVHEIAFAGCAFGRDECQVAAAVHVPRRGSSERLAGVHDVASDWKSHATRSQQRRTAQPSR